MSAPTPSDPAMAVATPPPRGYVDPNIPNPGGENDVPIIIYGYTPSMAFAIASIALFAVSLMLHVVRTYLHRNWAFCSLMLIGILFELVGYVFRLRSSSNPYNLNNFVIQYFFIVVAPVIISAALYTTLTSMMSRLRQEHGLFRIRRRSIVAIFVACDVVATAIQVAGAALIGVAESNRQSSVTPNNILLAGLAFQVFDFFIFLMFLGHFVLRNEKVILGSGVGDGSIAKRFVLGTAVASLLIYLRTCFRLAETAQGVYGALSSSEPFFGGLEFAPVVLAVYILGWWHPGKWLHQH